MAYGDDQISANPLARFGGLAFGVGLYFLGGLIPILLTCVALFAVKKLFPRLPEAAVFFSGLATGQLLWFLAGAILAPGLWLAVAPDLVIGGLLIAWFLARPSAAPAALLMAFEVIGLGMNGWTLTEVGFSNPAGKALIFHIVLRVAIIGGGVLYLLKRNDIPVVTEAFE
jgi:hypothetical protein